MGSRDDRIDRNSYIYRKWKSDVVERDGHKCVRCGETKHVEAHHIKPYAKFPELAVSLDNGITLCRKCHSEEHNKNYGKDEIIADKISSSVHPFFLFVRDLTFYISYRADILRKFCQEFPISRSWKTWIGDISGTVFLLCMLLLCSYFKKVMYYLFNSSL